MILSFIERVSPAGLDNYLHFGVRTCVGFKELELTDVYRHFVLMGLQDSKSFAKLLGSLYKTLVRSCKILINIGGEK